MEKEKVRETDLLIRKRVSPHIAFLVKQVREVWMVIEIHPQFAVLLGDLNERLRPPRLNIDTKGNPGKEERGNCATNLQNLLPSRYAP